MSIRFSLRKWPWISQVLVLVLTTVISPIHVAAQTQSSPCEGTSIRIAQAASRSIHAADEEVTIPKELVDQSVFVANFATTFKGSGLVEVLIDAEFLARLPRVLDADAVMAEYQRNYLNSLPTAGTVYGDQPWDVIVHAKLDAALRTPGLAPVVPDVWNYISEGLAKQIDQNYRTRVQSYSLIGESARRYNMGATLISGATQQIQTLHECAQTNPSLAAAVDKQFKGRLKISIRDSAKQMFAQNPDLPILKEIRDRIGENGAINISINELKSMSQNEFGKIDASIAEMQKTLTEIDAKQDVLVDYVNDQKKRQEQQDKAAAAAARTKLQLEAAQSTLFVIQTLTGFIDPKLAAQISTVGTSALQIAGSVNHWLDAVAGLSALDKLGSLSTVVMTGNVLGAVMNVVSLFGSAGPSPDEMILEEIGKLRQDIGQLRTQMHARFDHIDKELNTIYSTMQDRFNLIDVQLGKLNGKLDEVQQSLIELDTKLSRIERTNFEFLNALGRRPLLEAVNGGLDYQQTTGLPMPYDPNFVSFANLLYTWGTQHAFDELEAGPNLTDFSDSNALNVLNAYPVDVNLNYLNGWLMNKGLPAIADKRLANPRTWMLASRAYSQLGSEWPAHMRRYDRQRQVQLDAVGADVQAAMLNISTLNTLSGTVGNQLLFSNVITNYQNKINTLTTTIQTQIETPYLQNIQAQLQRSSPFDLYGGIEQALSYQTSEVSTMTCNRTAEYGYLPATNNLRSLIPNFNLYNLADYLRLGTLSVCMTEDWGTPVQVCYVEQEPPFQEFCDQYSNMSVVLTVYFNNVSIMSQSVTDPGPAAERVSPGKATREWLSGQNYKAQLEALTSVDPPSPELAAQRAALLNSTTHLLEEKLAAYQQAMYMQVKNALMLPTSVLGKLAAEAAGSKAVLDHLVSLGLSRAVGDNDFLHAMLYGDQSLVDDNQIVQSYTLSATGPITGTSLMVNPRLVIGQMAEKRTTAFAGLINDYLTAISAKTHVEDIDYIANTRRVLDLAVRIAQVEPQPAITPTLHSLFIPMSMR